MPAPQLPSILSITLEPGQISAGFKGNPQEFYEEILTKTKASLDASKFLLGQIGGPVPNTNVGPYLKNQKEWWVWDEQSSAYVPMSSELEIGDIAMTAKTECDDDHWLFCDGREISRNQPYDQLFAAIGTTWGEGDGSTTFNIPRTGSRTPIGVGIGKDQNNVDLTQRKIGEYGGIETVSLKPNEIPQNNYANITNGNVTPVPIWGNYFADGDGHNNMPPWFAVLFKIKYR
jgi:hypothetical protein